MSFNLCLLYTLVGTHYETISCVFRALGAKVGARVFWPGSGVFVADGAFDLLEAGVAHWNNSFDPMSLKGVWFQIVKGVNVLKKLVSNMSMCLSKAF